MQAVQPNPAVKVRRMPRGEIDCVANDQNTAVYRPHGFQPVPDHRSPVERRASEPPNQLAVRNSQRVNITIPASEDRHSAIDRRRRIDTPGCDERPQLRAILSIKTINRLPVNRADEHFIGSHNNTGQHATDIRFPLRRQINRHLCARTTAPRHIMTIRRPLFRIGIRYGRRPDQITSQRFNRIRYAVFNIRRHLSVGLAPDQSWSIFPLSFCLLCGERMKTIEFDVVEALTRMRRHIDQAIAWHDAILTHTAQPPVVDVIVASQVDVFQAAPAADQITFSRLVAITAMVVAAG